ncbi:hypothetical protein [Lactovum miscens]|uniref:Uncharacterized protein n=1 Tax=Lactovum miscens TaxID=190387 RepID=A0A841C7N2_9LACT|nr:hypothetical protein [Lactovum miscens]MBB5887602.1 hypothetical protein [Lactovum miscens]
MSKRDVQIAQLQSKLRKTEKLLQQERAKNLRWREVINKLIERFQLIIEKG